MLNVARVTQAHADARVQDILRAGSKVFAERGSEGATMAEIASEAGLSTGTIYLYFSNKADLLRAVCSMKHEGISQILSDDARVGESPMQLFERIGRLMGAAYDDPGLREQSLCSLESVLLGVRDPDGFGVEQRQINAEVTATLAELMAHAQAAGELDPSVDPDDLAVVLFAFAQGLRELHLTSPDRIDARRAYDLIGRFVRGEVAGPSHDRQQATGNRQQATGNG